MSPWLQWATAIRIKASINIAAQARCGLYTSLCVQMKDMACNNTTEPRSCHASACTDRQTLWCGARDGQMSRTMSALSPGPQSTPQKPSYQYDHLPRYALLYCLSPDDITCTPAPVSQTIYKNTACTGKAGLPEVPCTYKNRCVAIELHSKLPGVANCNVEMRSWSEDPEDVVCTAVFQIPHAPPEITRTSSADNKETLHGSMTWSAEATKQTEVPSNHESWLT